MTQYILQAHRNKIDSKIDFMMPYHTGYDLITIHADGSKTIGENK